VTTVTIMILTCGGTALKPWVWFSRWIVDNVNTGSRFFETNLGRAHER